MLCRRLQSVCLAVLLAPPCFPAPVLSQSSSAASDDVQTLESLVVTATKTPVPLRHVTSAVEVWTEEDLRQRNVKTVVEALRLSQGTAVFQNGGPGTNATVRIRGGKSEQTLVLIDGAIVNAAGNGGFNFADLTVDNIGKIEIVRGAQSTLWGSEAMGGVIAITTKRGRGTPTAGSFFEYGAFNTVREGSSLRGKRGPVDFSVALSRWDTASISAANYRRGASERDAYRNWQGSAKLGTALPADGRVDVNFRWLNGSVDTDVFFGNPADTLKTKEDTTQFVFSGNWQQPLTDRWTHSVTLSRAESRALSEFGKTRGLTNRVESQHDVRINPYLTLTAGYQFREAQAAFAATKINASHAGFGQVQLTLLDRFFVTAGGRFDDFNTFGEAATYRVTGGYVSDATNTKIRGSYATGFRAPSINELFFPDFGNPDLRPERSQSMDVGMDQRFWDERVTVDIGYFRNRYRNLIQTIRSAAICGTGTFGPNYCPINAASATSQGWEGAVTAVMLRDRPWAKRLEVRGRYTATLTRDLNTANRFARWPVHQSVVSVAYQPIEILNVTVDLRFADSQFDDVGNMRRLDSFTVVGAAASYDASERIQAYVRVDNLFDEEYEEVLDFGTPGVSVFGGLRVKFAAPGL